VVWGVFFLVCWGVCFFFFGCFFFVFVGFFFCFFLVWVVVGVGVLGETQFLTFSS